MSFGPWSNASSATTKSAGVGVLAEMSENFVQSMGINVHFNFGTGVWTDPTNWMPLLSAINFRHMRTAVGGANTLTRINQLQVGGTYAQSVSPKMLLIFNPAEADVSTIAADFNRAESYGLSKISGIELSNEINATTGTSNITGTPTQRADKAIAYAAAVKAELDRRPAWANIPVIGPSIWGRSFTFIDIVLTRPTVGLAWGPYVDGQPIHYYTGVRKPTICGASLDNADDNADHTLTEELDYHGKLVQNSSSKPLWMTETGWQMEDGGYTPAKALSAFTCTEIASSKYCSRVFLECYLRGVERTFWYAFLNNPGNNTYQGIVNHNANAPYAPYTSRRSVATMTRMISVLGESGASFTPTRLPYTFSGTGFDSDFHHKLFQKSNGVFYLLCTSDKSSYSRVTPYADINSSASVTLALGGSRSLVRTTTPHSTATWTTAGTNVSSVNLSVPDHLMIVEITP